MTDYKAALSEARITIEEQQAFIEQMTADPWQHATVVSESENDGTKTLIVADTSGIFEVLQPSFPCLPGNVVRLNPAKGIHSVTQAAGHGPIATMTAVDGAMGEAEVDSQIRRVHLGQCEAEKSDRVVLDPTGTVVVCNLGKEESHFLFDSETNVTFDDIGGLAEAKQMMREAVLLPAEHPELYKFYGKKPISGLLLHGPPGTGKTMLGKAAATALSNGERGGFFYVSGPSILSKWVGTAEATIRQIFERARAFKEEHGHPAIVFLDEADAVLASRGSGISSDMEKTIVPQFLTEMDGLEESGAVVILATNRADTLDPAVTRDGRIDRKVRVSRPDRDGAAQIFSIYLQKVPLLGDCREFANLGADELHDEKRTFYIVPTKKGKRPFTLADISHGGMIAGIVDQATSLALDRNLSGSKEKGVRREDLVEAVDRVFQQNVNLNHTSAVEELVEAR